MMLAYRVFSARSSSRITALLERLMIPGQRPNPFSPLLATAAAAAAAAGERPNHCGLTTTIAPI